MRKTPPRTRASERTVNAASSFENEPDAVQTDAAVGFHNRPGKYGSEGEGKGGRSPSFPSPVLLRRAVPIDERSRA